MELGHGGGVVRPSPPPLQSSLPLWQPHGGASSCSHCSWGQSAASATGPLGGAAHAGGPWEVHGDMRAGQGTDHSGPCHVVLALSGVPHCRGLVGRTHERGGGCWGGGAQAGCAGPPPPATFSPCEAGGRKLNLEPGLCLGSLAVVTWHWAKNILGDCPWGWGSRGHQLGDGDSLQLLPCPCLCRHRGCWHGPSGA